MKRKTAFIMATIFLLVMLVPFHVFADTGPKPSVNIKVEGYEGKAFYITLFSARPSTGPHSAYNGEEGYAMRAIKVMKSGRCFVSILHATAFIFYRNSLFAKTETTVGDIILRVHLKSIFIFPIAGNML